MASNYALLLVPSKKIHRPCAIEIEQRHVSKVPGPISDEVAFDTTLDPEAYNDNVSLAAELCRLIHHGRRYESVKAGIINHLCEMDDIIGDLSDQNVNLTVASRGALFRYVSDRIRDIGKCIDFKIEHKDDKEETEGGDGQGT